MMYQHLFLILKKTADKANLSQEYYRAKASTSTLNYIKHGDKKEYSKDKEVLFSQAVMDKNYREQNKSIEVQSEKGAVTPAATVYLDKHNWYYNMVKCGWISGGKCGFIALNLLYAEHDMFRRLNKKSRYVDDNVFVDNYTGLNDKLSKKLYNLAPKDSTTAIHINKVSKLYAAEKKLSISHSYWIAPIANINSVIKKIGDTGNSLIIFGYVFGSVNGAHAVLGYDVNGGRNYVWCHLGYNERNATIYDGIVGSYYYMEPK